VSGPVEVLGTARLDGRAIDWPAATRPGDEAEGYRLQGELAQWLGARGWGRRVGWKVGATTRVMQQLLEIDHPCAGAILEARRFYTAATLPYASLCRPGIECEIAVRLGSDVPPDGAPYDAERIAPYIATVMPAMELVDDRYGNFRTWPPAALIADDFFQSACVLGSERANWRIFDLPALPGVTRIDGREVGRGSGAEVMGNPIEALVWLANRLAELGQGLKSGEFVLLGSLVAVQWLEVPAEAETEIVGLGKVSLKLA
jgi:2-keto-4-pentenoate hydratase